MTFSKKLYALTFYCKKTRALTFENLCQEEERIPAAYPLPPGATVPPSASASKTVTPPGGQGAPVTRPILSRNAAAQRAYELLKADDDAPDPAMVCARVSLSVCGCVCVGVCRFVYVCVHTHTTHISRRRGALAQRRRRARATAVAAALVASSAL